MITEEQREYIKKQKYYQYAEKVLSGERKAGKLEILAVQRFMSDLERDDLIFDEKAVDKVVNFIQIMKLTEDEFAGRPFVLMDWCSFTVANIYGFYRRDDGSRRYTLAYVEIGRKNAKSTFMAALCLYELLCNKTMSNQIVAAANSISQASLLLKYAQHLVKTIDPKSKLTSTYRNEIRFNRTQSFMKVVSSDASRLDGLSLKTFVIDELHEAKDDSLFRVLRSSQGAVKDPLGIIITTAGFNLNGFCYSLRTQYIDVLNGLKENDSVFALIYTIDDDDDWMDESIWVKANPSYGITIKERFMREECADAKNNPSAEVPFKTKLLNIWCQSSDVWLNSQKVMNCMKKVDLDDFKSESDDEICYLSYDLAATNDITSLTIYFPNGCDKDRRPTFKNWYFIPRDSIKDRGDDKWMYDKWVKEGFLITTPGNVTDYQYVEDCMLKLQQKYRVYKVAYDSWNSTQFAIRLTEDGFNMTPYSQSTGNFNGATREMERLVLSEGCVIDANPVTRWMFDNIEIYEDINANRKPKKNISGKKIDGVISILMGLGQGMQDHQNLGGVFTF